MRVLEMHYAHLVPDAEDAARAKLGAAAGGLGVWRPSAPSKKKAGRRGKSPVTRDFPKWSVRDSNS